MWISLLSIRTLHADKILIVVRDGAVASRPQCALAPFCHQPHKRVRPEPSIDRRIQKAEIATGHCRRPFFLRRDATWNLWKCVANRALIGCFAKTMSGWGGRDRTSEWRNPGPRSVAGSLITRFDRRRERRSARHHRLTIWVLIALYFLPPGHLMDMKVSGFKDQASCQTAAKEIADSVTKASCYRLDFPTETEDERANSGGARQRMTRSQHQRARRATFIASSELQFEAPAPRLDGAGMRDDRGDLLRAPRRQDAKRPIDVSGPMKEGAN
jgi:hypothetical protein